MQSDYIKTKINRYQGNSPISIYKAMDQMIKDIKLVIYKMMLIQDRICTFEKINRIISTRRKIKKIRIQQREVFNI